MFIHSSFRRKSTCLLGVLIELSPDRWLRRKYLDSQQALVLFGGYVCDEAYFDWQVRMLRITLTTVTACSSYLELFCAKTSQDALWFVIVCFENVDKSRYLSDWKEIYLKIAHCNCNWKYCGFVEWFLV